tara:strand:+ start:1455 stop:2048 length:594 start_codon:yes stop_codon:yes gene_type:complete
MSVVSRTADLFYAFRFLKLLVSSWDKTDAYELGIIDADGKLLKKAQDRKTPQEKSAYTVFHRLVFNVKRLLNKLPFGKTKLASYASALFLIKENTNLTDDEIRNVLNDVFEDLEETIDISESAQWFDKSNKLAPGTYTLTQEIASPVTGEVIANINTKVKAIDFTEAYGEIFGLNVYQVEHVLTKQKILVTSTDLKR